MSIQSQIINLLVDLRSRFNLTYLFVAHNLSVIEYISDRVGVMYLGKLVELADVVELYKRPRHPYTIALLSAVPNPDPRVRKKRLVLEGDVPSPANPPSGCRFHTRCWLRTRLGNPENCATDEPAFRDIGAGHRVACHYAEQITDATVAELVPIAKFTTPPVPRRLRRSRRRPLRRSRRRCHPRIHLPGEPPRSTREYRAPGSGGRRTRLALNPVDLAFNHLEEE